MRDQSAPSIIPSQDQATGVALTLSSWAVPNQHDDEVWETMTREQQLVALQDHFSSQDCTTPTACTVSEIVARTRAAQSAS